MTEILIRDVTTDQGSGAGTRTLTFDLPAPWLLHGLFRSDAYAHHVGHRFETDVGIATADGYAVGSVYPTDGQPPEKRSLEDFLASTPSPPQDKAAVTFRTDILDVEAVIPAVKAAADRAQSIREDVVSEANAK